MVKINWDEYKEYKKYAHSDDNFAVLLSFMKSYYNMINPVEIYNSLAEDGLGQMMLEKHSVTDAEGLEKYLFKSKL